MIRLSMPKLSLSEPVNVGGRDQETEGESMRASERERVREKE